MKKHFLLLAISGMFLWGQSATGIFENRANVGAVLHPGSLEYDSAKRSYIVTGSGENMWFNSDAFHFVWKKVSGDVTLGADIAFVGTGGNAHRKAVLVIRQNLDADSAYADVALHGNGLTSLQWRDEKGAITREVGANISAPKRLRLLKRGSYFYMELAGEGGDPKMAGGSAKVPLSEPFYAGIGVCAHDKDAIEKAVFTNVTLETPAPAAASAKRSLYSTLETVPVASADRRVVHVGPEPLEAPIWTRDGAAIVSSSSGHIRRIELKSGAWDEIPAGGGMFRPARYHGFSPDGTLLAVSDANNIYVMPAAGGTPRRVTRNSPSYFHGWSPDGKTIAFAGERDKKLDIYTIPAEGGEETRLTTAKGVNGGPEFSPDGQFIYFHSDRGGSMQIWRMRPDGTAAEQVTDDTFGNWYPHVAPDGLSIAFLSRDKTAAGAPEFEDVTLRVMTLADKKVRVVAKLLGGQGTLGASPWSPDGKQLTFVSYQLIP